MRALAYLQVLVAWHARYYDLMLRTILNPDIPLGDNKERDGDTGFRILADHYVNRVMHELRLPHELLPADGHDQALSRALAFATARLTGQHARYV